MGCSGGGESVKGPCPDLTEAALLESAPQQAPETFCMHIRWIGALALTFATSLSFAQGFPAKPIRFIVPYLPGGTTDLVARKVGEQVSHKLGQPVVIENKPGAGGN